MNTELTGRQLDLDLPTTVIVDALASDHDHFREEDKSIQGLLIENSIRGGTDTVGAMPNTLRGIRTAAEAVRYGNGLRMVTPLGQTLHVIRYIAITEDTTEKMLDECIEAGIYDGKILAKYRTTNSDYGVVRYGKLLPIIRHGGRIGMRFHGHFEHPSPHFTNDDAEFACLPLVYMYLEETEAKIIWQHGTEGRCVPHWKEMAKSRRFYVTLTPQHLLTTDDETYGAVGEICKPSYGDPFDREALNALVDLDLPWVMAGPDVAPHPIETKHPPKGGCSCGAYHAPFLHPLYAHALQRLFRTQKSVETYINFTSRNLRTLHRLPGSSRAITLVRRQFEIPLLYQIGPWKVQPFWAGKMLDWSIA